MEAHYLMLSPQEISDIIGKMKKADTEGPAVALPMSFGDWVTYYALLLKVNNRIPGISHDDLVTIENLIEVYRGIDEAGQIPTGP